GLSPDEHERTTGFGVALKPMVRRPVHQRTFSHIDASAGSAEHGDADARLGPRRPSLPFEDSLAALHPIRLPGAVKGPASLVVDPPIIGHEIGAGPIGCRIPWVEAAQTMHHPIKRPLPPRSVRSAEKIYEIIIRHKERSLLDGSIIGRASDSEEFD